MELWFATIPWTIMVIVYGFFLVVALFMYDENENNYEDGYYSFPIGLGFTLGLILLSTLALGKDTIPWLFAHWVQVLVYFAGYVVTALVWAFGRWYFLVRRKLAKFLAGEQEVLVTNFKHAQEHGNYKDKTLEWYFADNGYPPSAAKYKVLILTWMVYWPLSVTLKLLHFPRIFFTWLRDITMGFFSGLSQRIFDSHLPK